MSAQHQSPEENASADRKADFKAVLVVFCALVAGAVYFVSGWTFDF